MFRAQTGKVDAVFGSGSDLLWWQACNRALVVFVYGLFMLRIAGRRLFGKWAAPDIIVSIIIGSSLSRAATGNAALGPTLAGTSVLMLLHWIVVRLVASSSRLARLIEGVPFELGRAGRVDAPHLRARAVSSNDLEEALRQSGVERVEDTSRIVLEPSGKITVVKAGRK